MVWVMETVVSSRVLLCVIFIHGVHGTFFPPVSNPPPVPAQSVRILPNSPQGFYIRQELQQEPPQPAVKDEGLFLPDPKPDEQRWYFQENQSRETGEVQGSIETFGRYYQSGEPAIGPVATPIPDDTYVAQPSSISKLNPQDPSTAGGSDIWILRGSDSQFNPERWIQVPTERFIEVINQNSGPPSATNPVKSVVVPETPEVPIKTQFSSNPPTNIVQQILVRAPGSIELQKLYTNQPAIVDTVPSVRQVVDISPPNVKQVVQQNIVSDLPPIPIPPPAPAQIASKKSFTVPPPQPPPLKAIGSTPKVVSSGPVNVISDANLLVSGKNSFDSNALVSNKNQVQRVRHVWVPISSRTGKFITIPLSESGISGKSVNNGLSLDSTPVTVSDTWVLKQDGPIPSFEKQKSILPPAPRVLQNGKVILQNPSFAQIDGRLNPPIITRFESPKNQPVIVESIGPNSPIDVWPIRKEVAGTTVVDKSSAPFAVSPPKSDTVIIDKSFPAPPIAQQKTVFENGKSPLPPPILPPSAPVVNGKPCPIPPPAMQNSLFPPRNPSLISVPKVISSQRTLPFARIVRINRYPTGSYYLLNRSIRPSYFTYPNPTLNQQPKTGLVRLVQTQQIPIDFQGKQPLPPAQTKQISIPVRSNQIASPSFDKQVTFPVPTRQIMVPVSSKSTRIVYPTVQAVRYAYPLNAFVKSSPIPGKGVYAPQFNPIKLAPIKINSDSSSSESSSSEGSSESSEDKKEAKSKKEKLEKEEKPQKEESEKESESNSENKEKESESTSKVDSEESMVTAESQISLSQSKPATSANNNAVSTVDKSHAYRYDLDKNDTIQHRQEVSNVDRRVAHGSSHANYVSNQGAKISHKAQSDSEEFIDSVIADFVRD